MPKWVIYATITMLIFAVAFTIMPLAEQGAKALSPGMIQALHMTPPAEKNGLSPIMIQILSSFGLVPFAAYLLFSKKIKQGSNFPRGIFFALICGVGSGVGNLMVFQALAADGPVSLVVPITAMPLIPVILGPFIFKERLSVAQILGVVIAFVAIVLLNVKVDASLQNVNLISDWMLYSLLALLIFGAAMTAQKAATFHISDELSTVIYTISFLALSGFLIVWDKDLSWKIPPMAGGVALLFGALMGAATLMFYAAYRFGKATVVSPYVLLYPLVTVLAAIPLYGEKPDMIRGAGIVLAVAACVLLGMERSQAAALASTAAAADSTAAN